MKLLPEVKKLEIRDGILSTPYILPYTEEIDSRIKMAIDKLPVGDDGVKLIINTKGGNSEKYSLEISKDSVVITSDGLNGVFYGIQTLRQIFRSEEVPFLRIEDEPDFEYRGLYHDITRGKVPTVDTLKKLIDHMAYFKMNSLQLYVEHTFEFEETKELIKRTGYISREELKQLDKYCRDNFIDFIPSIATFGHMYEILEQDKYRHLRVCKDVKTPKNFWRSRMAHHTIDPLNPESIELVTSLIDQYEPNFCTDKFNICGDETFDLENYGGDVDTGKLYVDFIHKIIVHLKNKKIMMWADVLLHHPETLDSMPDDVYYLNWDYAAAPSEENVAKISALGRKQIVCPGTWSWSRLCEDFDLGESNITRLIDYGYKYNAVGVLNTNWGDYGNPASIEMAMYGIMLGGVKSWRVATKTGEEFYDAVNDILYGGKNALEYLKRLSTAHTALSPNWNSICTKYFEVRYGEKPMINMVFDTDKIPEVQRECIDIINELSSQKWIYDEARKEMILCAEGICVLAQAGAKLFGATAPELVNTKNWMKKYKEMWLSKNKKSEISKIEEMILFVDAM